MYVDDFYYIIHIFRTSCDRLEGEMKEMNKKNSKEKKEESWLLYVDLLDGSKNKQLCAEDIQCCTGAGQWHLNCSYWEDCLCKICLLNKALKSCTVYTPKFS